MIKKLIMTYKKLEDTIMSREIVRERALSYLEEALKKEQSH